LSVVDVRIFLVALQREFLYLSTFPLSGGRAALADSASYNMSHYPSLPGGGKFDWVSLVVSLPQFDARKIDSKEDIFIFRGT
jgi:hypothetical protein